MRTSSLLTPGIVLLCMLSCSVKEDGDMGNIYYLNNRAPLRPNPFIELPLGSIRPEGWLKEQLNRMAEGMTGHLDTLYPQVLGKQNGWLGGDGDGWERGPYWLDGLVPLAYLLNDSVLIRKALPWIEWSLNNQGENGYFGPVPFKIPPDPSPVFKRTGEGTGGRRWSCSKSSNNITALPVMKGSSGCLPGILNTS